MHAIRKVIHARFFYKTVQVKRKQNCAGSARCGNVAPVSDQTFQKSACTLCGGEIEFPANAGGMTVECPHCHQQTELRATGTAVPNVTRLVIFAVVGVAIAIGILFLLKSPMDAQRANLPVVASNSVPALVEAARAKAADDLKLVGTVSVEKAKGSRLSYAMGTITNDSNHQRYGVRVELDLFDQAGNKLTAQANDYRQTLEPGKDWKFRALVLDAKAVTAKLAAIKEEE
jgi:hypothetical protein